MIIYDILATVVDSSSKRLLRVIYIYYDDNEFLVDDLLIGIAIYKELMTPYGQHGVYYSVFSSLKTVRDYRETGGQRAVTVAREFAFSFALRLFVCALLSWSTSRLAVFFTSLRGNSLNLSLFVVVFFFLFQEQTKIYLNPAI